MREFLLFSARKSSHFSIQKEILNITHEQAISTKKLIPVTMKPIKVASLHQLFAMETHLQGVGFHVVAKEGEGADAGFTLALFFIRSLGQVSPGPISLKET